MHTMSDVNLTALTTTLPRSVDLGLGMLKREERTT
jgi:hypothetical protein